MNRAWRAIWAPVDEEPVPWAGTSLRLGPLERLDRWALGLIAIVFLLLLINIGHLKPSMSDTWYHVGVAKQFMAEGGIVGWDWWNYAPTGRPHLYPPLLHLILAFLAGLTGSAIIASQLCAVTFMPLGLLTTWCAARRILGAAPALVAVLLVMTDMMHFIIMEAHIAGCLINILLPVLLVAFLARRVWWSILLLTLMFYSHLGFPLCVALGLLVFGARYRGYLRPALKVVGISALFFTPWLSHVLAHLDWLPVLRQGGMPGTFLTKLLSLQGFNLLVLTAGFWGLAVAPRRQPERMLPAYMLIGFLPILLSYGGRYTMHTMPLWAILGASVLGGMLRPAAPARRIAGIMLLTLLPWPTLSFMGGFRPLPLTASHLLLLITARGTPLFGEGDKSEAYRPDCEALAAWLQEHTRPDEIIYTNTVWIADMISLLTNRATDFGAWWECSKEMERIEGRALRDWLPTATFVYVKPEADTGSLLWQTPRMPGVDQVLEIGRFQIGLRRPHRLARRGSRVTDWEPLNAAGATGVVEFDGTSVCWRFARKSAELALISAPAPAGRFAGARLTLSSSETADDLVFGIQLADAREYRWPLSLAQPDVPYNVRVVFAWMTDAAGQVWDGGEVDRVYLSCPPKPGGRGKVGERKVKLIHAELVPAASG